MSKKSETKIPICEIFGPTIQGEGARAGEPTVFIRVAGCVKPWCIWCDSLYAVDPKYKDEWTIMTPKEIFAKASAISKAIVNGITLTLTGGDPVMYDFMELVGLSHKFGCKVVVETQGQLFKEWLKKVDTVILSPKPPSSGKQTSMEILDKYHYTRYALKFVISTEEDYQFAKQIADKLHSNYYPVYLQPCNLSLGSHSAQTIGESIAKKTEWLLERLTQDNWVTNVRVLPQVHVLLWGNKRKV